MREKGIDICLITEVKTNEENIIKIRGYDIVIKNKEWDKGKGGRVMIGVKNGIKWERLTLKQMGKRNRKIEKK